MTTPTREQIEAAYNALEELYNSACALTWGKSHEEEEDWHSAILKVLPPLPKPTMADVEWDDDEHFLARAEQNVYGPVIMLGKDSSGLIKFLVPRFHESKTVSASPDTLTLTGKRYTLTEVQDD